MCANWLIYASIYAREIESGRAFDCFNRPERNVYMITSTYQYLIVYCCNLERKLVSSD